MLNILSIITSTAKMVGVSPGLVVAICMTETNLRNVDVLYDGNSASYGICQVKLETAHFMGKVHKRPKVKNFTDDDLRKIENNAKVAALYLKYQLNRYDGDVCKAVAAYNAGKYKASKKFVDGRPFNWTYVEKVANNYKGDSISFECGQQYLALN